MISRIRCIKKKTATRTSGGFLLRHGCFFLGKAAFEFLLDKSPSKAYYMDVGKGGCSYMTKQRNPRKRGNSSGGSLSFHAAMYARYDQTADCRCLLSVQPFADVVGYYTRHDGKDESGCSVHNPASFPAGDAAAWIE